jgi:hypothetical protein
LLLLIIFYCSGTLLFACWLGWNIHRKLDWYDWAFYRSDIWVDFGMRLVFWPIIIFLKPGILLQPDFKHKSSIGIDLAERYRQRAKFMERPPPCGAMVSYRPGNQESDNDGAGFVFRAADVEGVARIAIQEFPHLEGMRGAALWTSLRDGAVTAPTQVPEILVNFDKIVEDLIQAGLGYVHCPHCEKQYSATELVRETEMLGGWVYAIFICPAKHSLFHREVMHLMLKRNYD